MGMNFVIITGRLTADPELKYSTTGKAFSKFSIAVTRAHKKEEVDFINCTAFGKTAEVAGEYLRKGSKIGIQGSLRVSQYEQDGQKRSRTEVVVGSMEFLDNKKPSDTNKKSSDDFEEYVSSNNGGGDDDDFPF
jgi:single-strand DNA-binding protein